MSDLYVTRIEIREDEYAEPYVEALPVVRHLRRSGGLDIMSPITIIVGENGRGKSTLIEALAVS